MPLPFIAAAAAAAALVGVKKTYDAHCDNKEANEVNEEASYIIKSATDGANIAREHCNEALQRLGNEKVSILDNSMQRFLKGFTRIKNVDFSDSEGLNELNKLKFDQSTIKELKEMQSMASAIVGGVASGAVMGAATAFGAYGATMTFAAASTGTAISTLSGAAATNATLAWLGGGSLAAGGGGIAAGTAVLGGLVAAPALVVFGLVASSKASAKKDEAYANLAQAKTYREEMNTVKTLCFGMEKRADMFSELLTNLDEIFKPLIITMYDILIDNGSDYSKYSNEAKKHIAEIVAVAIAIKSILDTPILTEDGKLTSESEDVANNIKKFILTRQ